MLMLIFREVYYWWIKVCKIYFFISLNDD